VTITHLFFDIGGVLGTNGWGRHERAAAVEAFGLDAAELAERHEEAAQEWEAGRMTMDEYLGCAVFYRDRPFTREAFRDFMLARSLPDAEAVALARALAATGRWRMATLNNESAELNAHRVRAFGLAEIFTAFFSSCYLGVTKPSRGIFEKALEISQTVAARAVFIDDRARNCDVARALGFHTVLYTGAGRLRSDLAALGVTT